MLFPIGAAPHEVAAGLVIAIGSHAQLFLAQGRPVLVDGDGVRNRLWASAFVVQVDECPYPLAFKEPVGGIIVHCGVQAHVLNGNCRHMFSKFVEGDKEADRVMPPCAGEAHKQRDVRLEFRVVTRQLEQGIAVVIFVQVAVPPPGGIGIGEMAQVFRRAVPMVPAWGGMGVHGGAVAGNGKVFPGYEAAFHGRQDGHMVEKPLQELLKVKRNAFPVHESFLDGVGDFRLCLLCFLLFPFRLVGFFAVPGSAEQFVPGV